MSEMTKISECAAADVAAAPAKFRQAWSRPTTRMVAAEDAKASDAGATPDGTPFTS